MHQTNLQAWYMGFDVCSGVSLIYSFPFSGMAYSGTSTMLTRALEARHAEACSVAPLSSSCIRALTARDGTYRSHVAD